MQSEGFALFCSLLTMASSWANSCFEDSCDPCLMLSDPELLRTLKNSPTLRSLSILFESRSLEMLQDAEKCFMPLKGFRNLTSLELYNFYGNETQLVKELAKVLIDCSNLTTLGLGLLCDCDVQITPEIIVLDEECEFLEHLCHHFASRGAKPLHLQTLKLGTGMCLVDSTGSSHEENDSHERNNFLAKLTDLETLRTLHVFNDLVKNGHDDDGWGLEIDWSLLDDCTNLEQLSVSRFGQDVVSWVLSHMSIQELIVTHHYGMYDEDLDNFKHLLMPNLRMLFVREISTPKRSDENDWTDISSSDEDSESSTSGESDANASDPAGSESSSTNDQDSDSSSDADSFEIERLDKSTISILDRIPTGGCRLEQLSLCLDLETQWVSLRSPFSLHQLIQIGNICFAPATDDLSQTIMPG